MEWEELAGKLRSFLDEIEASHCLDIRDDKHLPPQTKVVVTCSKEVVVEFTILDNKTRKVLLKDKDNFPEPTEGILLGTEVPEKSDSQPAMLRPGKRQLLPGQLKQIGLLTYEVGGKKFYADGIRRVQIVLPAGTSYDLWFD